MRAEEFVLSNGLKVVHLHLPEAQSFRLLLNVPVGAAQDPTGKEGLAHILEHTVFCGSESTPEEELLGKIRMAGGKWNAFTGNSNTNYDLSASAEKPENFYVISNALREFITEPALDADRVSIEQRVIVNELRDGKDNLLRHPMLVLDKEMHFGNEPYVDIIGTQESILSISRQDLVGFIDNNYDAGHMTLYAAGPMTSDRAREVFEQTLSAIPNKNKEKLYESEIRCQPRDIRIERPDLHQNYTAFMFVFKNSDNPREKIVEIEAGKHISSFLIEVLRRKHGCFYSPESGGWNSSKDISQAFLSMSNTPEDSVVACHGIIEFYKDLDDIFSNEVLQASLDGTRFYFSRPSKIEADILNKVQFDYQNYGVLFDSEETLSIIDTITPEEIRAKARQILEGLTGMAVQGPDPHVLPSLEFMRDGLRPNQTRDVRLTSCFVGPAQVLGS